MDSVSSAGQARGYVSKYLGKDFGDRGDQLRHRLDRLESPEMLGELLQEGHSEDAIPELISEFRSEILDRLSDHEKDPRATRRRWGASQGLERRPIQVIGCDDPRLLHNISRELVHLSSVRWGKRAEHGQTAFFDLENVSLDNCPVLFSLLNDAAPRAGACAHNARRRG